MSNILADFDSAPVLVPHNDNVSALEGPRAMSSKILNTKTGHVGSHLFSYPVVYTPFHRARAAVGLGSICNTIDAVEEDIKCKDFNEFDEDDEDLQLVCKNSFLEWTPASQLDLFRCSTAPARAPAPKSDNNDQVEKLAIKKTVELPTKLHVKLQESALENARPDVEQSDTKQRVQQERNQPEPEQRNNYQVGQMQMTAATAAAPLYESSYMYSSFMYANTPVPYGGKTIAHHGGSESAKKQQSHGEAVWHAPTVPHEQPVYQLSRLQHVAHAPQVPQVSDLEQQQTKKGVSKRHGSAGAREQPAGRRQQLRVGSEPATDQPPVAMFVDLSVLIPRKEAQENFKRRTILSTM